MSRQHFWTFTCDRCGKQETLPSKSGSNTPKDWTVVDRDYRELDYCTSCALAYTAHVDLFFADTPDPVETHTVIDDRLEELDPETHPEAS